MSKLENPQRISLFMDFDIVCLSEVKCTYPFSMQGFKCIRSKVITGEETRGGTAVLFKNNLWEKVYDVRRLKDQIWFKLDNIKHFKFGAIYIPPRDSPFFSHDSFACIHEMITEDDFNTIILGDFNARIKDLDCFNDQSLSISYVTNIDTGTNSNGKDLKNLCNVHCLKPVNNMVYRDKTFNGNFTFKQGNSWISQIDWAFVSKSAIDCIVDFVVLNNVSLPTDHAPLQLKISHPTFQIDELVQRATQLGSTALPAYLSKTRPVRMENIDKQKFMDIIPSVETFWNEFPSVDVLSNALSETLYNTAKEAEIRHCTVKIPMLSPAKHGGLKSYKIMILDNYGRASTGMELSVVQMMFCANLLMKHFVSIIRICSTQMELTWITNRLGQNMCHYLMTPLPPEKWMTVFGNLRLTKPPELMERPQGY